MKRSIRSLAVLFLAAVAALVSPMQAQAAGAILVSADGVNFGPVYSGVLFDGIAMMVPGDTQTVVFHIRNTAAVDGYVRITLRNVTGDPLLTDELALSASVPGQPGSASILSTAAPCRVLNEGFLLPAGATMAVTTELTFAASSGNPTQNATASFDIGVNLTDTAVALPPTECAGADVEIPGTVPGTGELSYTGSEPPIMLIGITAFVTGAGLFLVFLAWRRRRENDDETRGS